MIYLNEDHSELETVVFDLGKVLFDYAPRRFMFELGIAPELYDRLMKIFPESPEWQELDMDTISDDEFLASALRKEPLLRKEITLYHKHWYDHFKAIPENVAAFYEVKEAGAKTYILSNFQKTCFRVMQEHNSFLDDFDGRTISFECHTRKPMPEIYQTLINSFSLNPERTVFIDDMKENIKAAQAAGLKTIHLPIGGRVMDYLTIG